MIVDILSFNETFFLQELHLTSLLISLGNFKILLQFDIGHLKIEKTEKNSKYKFLIQFLIKKKLKSDFIIHFFQNWPIFFTSITRAFKPIS